MNKKDLRFDIWHYNYCNKAIIDLYSYFNKEDIKFLSKFGINIKNRLYTEREFDKFDEILLRYYKTDKKDKVIQTSEMKKKAISLEQYIKILNIFHTIGIEYEL